jgi:hypothetical protein
LDKNKVNVLDYPPGGLGNFIAQVLVNDNIVSSDNLSFHDNQNKHKWYVSLQDASIDDSIDALITLKEKLKDPNLIGKLVIVHTYKHTHELLNVPNIKLYQVIIQEYGTILFYNKHLKVYNHFGGNPKKTHIIKKNWNTNEPWVERECSVLELKYQQSISNTPTIGVDHHINFDNFYKNKDSFMHEVQRLNPLADVERLYRIFCDSQEPILNKLQLVNGIINTIKQGIDTDISHLEPLDQAVVAGLLNNEYKNFEWQLPNKNTWFQSTGEIINIINTL